MLTTRPALGLLTACLTACALNPSRIVEVPPGYEQVVVVRGRERSRLFPGQRVDIALRGDGLREQYEDAALVGLEPQQRQLAFQPKYGGLAVAPQEQIALVKEVRSVQPFVLGGMVVGGVVGVVVAGLALSDSHGDPTAIIALGMPFVFAGMGAGAGAVFGAIFKNVNAWHEIGPRRDQWQFQLPDRSLLPEAATPTAPTGPRFPR